jgi:hypothetical protein
MAGITEMIKGGGITVKDSLIDAGVLCVVPVKTWTCVSTGIPWGTNFGAPVIFGTKNSHIVEVRRKQLVKTKFCS